MHQKLLMLAHIFELFENVIGIPFLILSVYQQSIDVKIESPAGETSYDQVRQSGGGVHSMECLLFIFSFSSLRGLGLQIC